MYKLKFTC